MQIFGFMYKLTEFQDNKRRTLQRNDIAMAITKYDQFDFLIDIVPRYCFYRIHFWSKPLFPPKLKNHVSPQGWYQANNKEGRIKCEDGSWSGHCLATLFYTYLYLKNQFWVAWPVINVQVSYYFQLAQQHQQQLQQNSGSPTQAQQVQLFLSKIIKLLSMFKGNL